MEVLKPAEDEVKRRSDLISESKTRNLSGSEVQELQTILTKEAWYSYASGEIGLLAFICIHKIIESIPLLSGV